MRVVAAAFAVLAVLAFAGYAAAFYPGYQGWGYAGYGGYHHGPSIFYFGSGVETYHERSVRSGSRSGPGVRSGGIAGGK